VKAQYIRAMDAVHSTCLFVAGACLVVITVIVPYGVFATGGYKATPHAALEVRDPFDRPSVEHELHVRSRGLVRDLEQDFVAGNPVLSENLFEPRRFNPRLGRRLRHI